MVEIVISRVIAEIPLTGLCTGTHNTGNVDAYTETDQHGFVVKSKSLMTMLFVWRRSEYESGQ